MNASVISVGFLLFGCALGCGNPRKTETLQPAPLSPGKPAAIGSYQGQIEEAHAKLQVIHKLIDTARFLDMREHTDAVRRTAAQLAGLASKPDSGIPAKESAKVPSLVDELNKHLDALDKAATMKAPAAADKAYGDALRVLNEMESLKSKSRHGGQVKTDSTRNRVVEVTLSATGEMRVYAYRMSGEAVPADRVNAAGKIGNTKAPLDQKKSLQLAPGPGNQYLLARLDPSMQRPLSARIFVDFRDGQNPTAFDFEFESLPKEAEVAKDRP